VKRVCISLGAGGTARPLPSRLAALGSGVGEYDSVLFPIRCVLCGTLPHYTEVISQLYDRFQPSGPRVVVNKREVKLSLCN
jgi:hypothetical protein